MPPSNPSMRQAAQLRTMFASATDGSAAPIAMERAAAVMLDSTSTCTMQACAQAPQQGVTRLTSMQ